MYKYKGKNYDFIFTIFDDTDNATIENIKPIYDLLHKHDILTTKSVWPLKVKKFNSFTGDSLQDTDYLDFILDLKHKGFEIALHNVGSGQYLRKEIIDGLETYKQLIGSYPNIHANHSSNSDNVYWGSKRFLFPINIIYHYFNPKKYLGEEPNSPFFWGDFAKKHIKYIRNHTFHDLNTLKYDPYMPYYEKKKLKYSNFWFSSSDALNVSSFNHMLTKQNIDQLANENGISIIYTHFASGFCVDGKLNKNFVNAIEYLSSKNGLFLPVSDVLDYLLERKYYSDTKISYFQKMKLDYLYISQRIKKRLSKNEK